MEEKQKQIKKQQLNQAETAFETKPPLCASNEDENVDRDARYMALAMQCAERALALGEVPIGAVVVWDDGRVVGEGYNTRESEKNALHHAECIAIDAACRTLGGWRLHRATLYVTLEPCPMCAGAIINARIRRVVFGARDPKAGAFGSVGDLNQWTLNHHPSVTAGVLETQCGALLTDFFHKLRH